MGLRQSKLAWILYPLGVIYGFIAAIRNWMYDVEIFKSKEFDIPIISVGNITVGGTGKTPHTEYLIGFLRKEFSVATLSRGYKRKTKGFVLADAQSSSFDIGDEAKQVKSKFNDIYVAVDENRVRAINKLCTLDKELEVIVLDDAFQHRRVEPGISILLMDFERPIYHDHYLPFGDLRESNHEHRRANILIVTKSPEDLKPIDQRIIAADLNVYPFQELYFTKIIYQNPLHIFAPGKTLTQDRNLNILAITGIARPNHFIKHLNKYGKIEEHLQFPDHHNFNKQDMQKIKNTFEAMSGNKVILTTEKDVIRLRDSFKLLEGDINDIFYIPITVDFIHDNQDKFKTQIIQYVKKNKRNRKPYKRKA